MTARVVLLALVLVGAVGCSGQAELIRAMAKDPAAACAVLSSPYGGLLVARAMPGARVELAGGTCSITQVPQP